jgi:hypothetical protein
MPVRKISKSNSDTKHIVSGVSTGTTTKVKRVTLGRPVRRVTSDNGTLSGLNDINLNGGPTEGDVLVYHESDEAWHAQKLLEKQEINGGQY